MHLKDTVPQIIYSIKTNQGISFHIWFVELTEMYNNAT